MKRLLKILRVVLTACGVLLTAALAFYAFVLPSVVEGLIRDSLAEMGFPDAELEVRGISFTGLQITDLSLRPDNRLTAGSIDVEFDLGSLRDGRVDVVRLTGVTWEIRIRDGEVDLGPLEDLDLPEKEGDGELPFDRIEIRSSTILVRRGAEARRLPLDGVVTNAGAGRLAAALAVDGMTLAADYRPREDGDRLDLRIEGSLGTVDTVVAGRHVSTGVLSATGSLSLVDLRTVDIADLVLELGSPRLDGLRLDHASLEVKSVGETLAWHAKIRRDPETALEVDFETPADLRTVVDPDRPQHLGWRLSGEPRGRLGAMLASAGLVFRGPARLDLSGDAVLRMGAGGSEGFTLDPLTLAVDFRSGPLAVPDAGLEADGASVSFRLRGRASESRLDLEVESLEMDIESGTDLPLARVTLSGPSRITGSPDERRVTLDSQLRIQVSRAGRDLLGLPLRLDRLDLTGTARVDLEPERLAIAIDQSAECPVTLRADGVHGTANRLGVTGEALWIGGELSRAGGTARMALDRIEVESADLVAQGLQAEIPFLLRGGGRTVGPFRIRSISYCDRDLPGLDGRFIAEPDRLSLEADWPFTAAARITVRGDLRLGEGGPSGSLTLAAPRFRVEAEDRIGKLLTDLTGLRIEGDFSVEGDLTPRDGAPVARAHLALTDGTVATEDGSQRLDGVTMGLTFAGLSPLATLGGQVLAWSGGRLGEFHLGEGAVAFRIEEPRSIHVERVDWLLGRKPGRFGRFWARSFRFDPSAPDIRSEIVWEHLELNDWLTLIAPENAVGAGTLYGRLPFRLRAEPKLLIGVGGGYLFAEAGGKLHLTDIEKIVAQQFPAGEDPGDYPEIVRRRIVHALGDFDFSLLRFDIVDQGEELSLIVRTVGRGAKVLPGTIGRQDLDVTVNFNGFEKILEPALGAKLGFEKAERTHPR